MPDICIFCATEDTERVEKIVNTLNKWWDVWWYKDMIDGNWNEHVEHAIKNSKCVVPVWTNTSVKPGKKVVMKLKEQEMKVEEYFLCDWTMFSCP